MQTVTTIEGVDIADLAGSFELSLRARNRSRRTVQSYLETVEQFRRWQVEHNLPTLVLAVASEHIETWLAELSENRRPTTVRIRYISLKPFWNWCVDEREVSVSPMERLKPPNVPEVVIPVPSQDSLKALLKACDGSRFEDVRYTAIIRLFADGGLRLSELTDPRADDIDGDLVTVRSGKGAKARGVVVGMRTLQSLDRYLRQRRRQSQAAASPWLWLARGRSHITSQGIQAAVQRRARMAGIGHLHCHQLRHFLVHRHLASGGSEVGAMRTYGWSSRAMLNRYGASEADRRAQDERRRLAPGDDL